MLVPVDVPVLGEVEPAPGEFVPDWPIPESGRPEVPPDDEPLVVSFGIDAPEDPLVPVSSELPPVVVEAPDWEVPPVADIPDVEPALPLVPDPNVLPLVVVELPEAPCDVPVEGTPDEVPEVPGDVPPVAGMPDVVPALPLVPVPKVPPPVVVELPRVPCDVPVEGAPDVAPELPLAPVSIVLAPEVVVPPMVPCEVPVAGAALEPDADGAGVVSSEIADPGVPLRSRVTPEVGLPVVVVVLAGFALRSGDDAVRSEG